MFALAKWEEISTNFKIFFLATLTSRILETLSRNYNQGIPGHGIFFMGVGQYVSTHRLCGAKSVPTPDEFTDAKKCSMPTSELWCRFGSDLALMWRLYLAYAKLVPTPESWCQVSNQLSSVGIDLASILGLILADAKSVPTPEIWCRFSTDLAPILRLQLAYAKSMPTPEIWC